MPEIKILQETYIGYYQDIVESAFAKVN